MQEEVRTLNSSALGPPDPKALDSGILSQLSETKKKHNEWVAKALNLRIPGPYNFQNLGLL